MYIDDICNVSYIMRCILFADDTNILKSGYDVHELASEISANLDILQRWFDIDKLFLNLQKTNFMLFGRHTHGQLKREQVKVYLNGQEVDIVNSTKLLGVIIDSRLNWYDQISRVSEKLSLLPSCIKFVVK